MKKFLLYDSPLIAIMVLITLLVACNKKETSKDEFLSSPKTEEPKPESRIHFIDGAYDRAYYQIIEVDGHQYLCNAMRGGIVHLESCPCKKKL